MRFIKQTVLLGLVSLLLTGCSVGNMGTLMSRKTFTDTATVLEVYSLGLQLRPEAFDRGASFGVRHAAYIFPCTNAKTGADEGKGWEWFRFKWPDAEDPVTRTNSTWGVEAQTMPEMNRLSAGYQDQVVTIDRHPEESKLVRISYNRSDPKSAYLWIKKGVKDVAKVLDEPADCLEDPDQPDT